METVVFVFILVVFQLSQTFSPQGDGNFSLEPDLEAIHSFSNLFPARGWKLELGREQPDDRPFSNLFPARGWKQIGLFLFV